MSMKAKLKERRKISQNVRVKSTQNTIVKPEPEALKVKRNIVFDTSKLNEPVLPDEYPIYGGYFYIADGKLYESNWHGVTVRQLKAREGFSEVRRCDIYGRKDQIDAQQ